MSSHQSHVSLLLHGLVVPGNTENTLGVTVRPCRGEVRSLYCCNVLDEGPYTYGHTTSSDSQDDVVDDDTRAPRVHDLVDDVHENAPHISGEPTRSPTGPLVIPSRDLDDVHTCVPVDTRRRHRPTDRESRGLQEGVIGIGP